MPKKRRRQASSHPTIDRRGPSTRRRDTLPWGASGVRSSQVISLDAKGFKMWTCRCCVRLGVLSFQCHISVFIFMYLIFTFSNIFSSSYRLAHLDWVLDEVLISKWEKVATSRGPGRRGERGERLTGMLCHPVLSFS